jgi:cell division protease FtsH
VNSNFKTAIFWVVLICVAVLLWTVVRTGKSRTEKQISFSEFVDQIKDKKIKEVTISGNEVHGVYQDGQSGLRTMVPTNYPALYDLLQQNGVNTEIKDSNSNPWFSLLV